MEGINQKISTGTTDSKNMSVGSLDVSNLYGSINVKKACQLVRQRALETNCSWEGINTRWALIYLALTLKPWEKVNFKLVDILPRRQNNQNKFPTIATVNLDETKDRWGLPCPLELISKQRKKEIMAAVLHVMVRTTFETHIYECEGVIYSQGDGCPTGLRPSGPISRIVMDFWVKEIKSIEAKSKELSRINPVMFETITIHLLQKYVDDVMVAGATIRPGIKWDQQSNSLILGH